MCLCILKKVCMNKMQDPCRIHWIIFLRQFLEQRGLFDLLFHFHMDEKSYVMGNIEVRIIFCRFNKNFNIEFLLLFVLE